MNGSILDDFKNAFNRPDSGHIQLILINVIVFVILSISGLIIRNTVDPLAFDEFLRYLALPSNTGSLLYKPWTLITYMFVHVNFFHIFWNMILLYWFSIVIKEFLGSDKIIGLYVLGGIAGGIAYILIYNLFFLERVELSILYGASAGVLAVVVGAAVFMPNYTFFLLFIGPVRIKYIALVAVFLSLINVDGRNAGGEIAHLGGAALGFFYIRELKKGSDWGQIVIRTIAFFKSFFIKQPKIKVSYNKNSKGSYSSKKRSTSTSSTKQTTSDQDEIDAILDKISQSGYDSLSKEEKQKLFNASKK